MCFRRVGQIYTLLMHPEAAHSVWSATECPFHPVTLYASACMRMIHAQLKYWTPVSDKMGKKEEARPSQLQTKIRPRSLQVVEISCSGLMQSISPASAGILNGLWCGGSGIQM